MSTSLCCLPLVSPLSRVYMIWSSWILILDMTYTAFLARPFSSSVLLFYNLI